MKPIVLPLTAILLNHIPAATALSAVCGSLRPQTVSSGARFVGKELVLIQYNTCIRWYFHEDIMYREVFSVFQYQTS